MPVYLIRVGDYGPVKIGFADDWQRRLCELQVANHQSLAVIRVFDGGKAEEIALHLRFADLRIRGEWFSFSRQMLGDLGLCEIQIAQASEAPPDEALPPGEAPEEEELALGARVRRLRRQAGMTQAELALQVGISRPYLAGVEIGFDLPGRNVLLALARFFGVSVERLYGKDKPAEKAA